MACKRVRGAARATPLQSSSFFLFLNGDSQSAG